MMETKLWAYRMVMGLALRGVKYLLVEAHVTVYIPHY
jgi:hypothetical protein